MTDASAVVEVLTAEAFTAAEVLTRGTGDVCVELATVDAVAVTVAVSEAESLATRDSLTWSAAGVDEDEPLVTSHIPPSSNARVATTSATATVDREKNQFLIPAPIGRERHESSKASGQIGQGPDEANLRPALGAHGAFENLSKPLELSVSAPRRTRAPAPGAHLRAQARRPASLR